LGLEIWHSIIAKKDPTPHTIKAFINWLRCFSSTHKKIKEAHLIALAAMFYCYEDDIEKAWKILNDYHPRQYLIFKNHFEKKYTTLIEVRQKHLEAFGELPSHEDFLIYQQIINESSIHRHN